MAGNQNGCWLNSLGIGGGYGGTSLSVVPEQQQAASVTTGSAVAGLSDSVNQFEQLDRAATGSNTLKRNPKMELTKSDLLKLVTYFEGEIQARDIVIAVLKSEKLKQVVNMGRYRPCVMTDPYTALLRDCSIIDGPTSKPPPVNEREMQAAAEVQLHALEQLAIQQRRAHTHMVNILRDAEAKHKKVIQELEEEKCKHEHDTAQGDDITYGLEMERTRLRQELELERTARKKLEKEVKRHQEMADEERGRQKQIVLLLLAERKKIIVKYIEERKRSEDLAQILSEEKSRIDNMAEGLEEESKKSLEMEAELEKQLHIFEGDKKTFKTALASKDVKVQELEIEVQKIKNEFDVLRNKYFNTEGTPMNSSVAKVVQPTATVSSVPVSGPTTGIAQSVAPGQALRQTATVPTTPLIPAKGTSCSPSPASATTTPSLPQAGLISANSSSSSRATTTLLPAKPGLLQQQQQQIASAAAAPPQTPPKKGSVLGRGVPPPIPPNKPVIPSKQNAG